MEMTISPAASGELSIIHEPWIADSSIPLLEIVGTPGWMDHYVSVDRADRPIG